MRGASGRLCDDVSRPGRRSGMMGHRDEERERLAREDDDERRAERERRAAQLREAWRQRHPGEEEREKERQDKERSR
jgi:hypothetical protein